MKTAEKAMRVCPYCGMEYQGVPALSRTDNQTLICPDCGTRQALESMGVSQEEQEKIVIALERFDRLINDISVGLPAEIELRRKQYEYYRNKLLSFEELSVSE